MVNGESKIAGGCRILKISFFFLLTSTLFFSSCKSHKPDISNIKVDLQVKRFEKDLFSLNSAKKETGIQNMISKYRDFFFFYFNDYRLWQMQNDSAVAWKDSVIAFAQDEVLLALQDSVEKKYTDFSFYKEQLTLSLRYFKYYFPEIVIPEVITVINSPARGAFTYGDSTLCIALDDYMGPEFSYYKFQDVPNYLLWRFRPEYIVPNSLQVLETHNFPFDPTGKKLLDAMIYNGKLTYLKSRFMPGAPDSLITNFRGKDLKWCVDNEKEIWKFFIDKNLLYSQDPLEYLKYVNDGPNTSGMPTDAPGNVGTWVGWRIVSKYMKQHKEISPAQLMQEADAQKILTDSKYKP